MVFPLRSVHADGKSSLGRLEVYVILFHAWKRGARARERSLGGPSLKGESPEPLAVIKNFVTLKKDKSNILNVAKKNLKPSLRE